LKIKGDFNLQAMKIFLKNKFSVEENKDYIVIPSFRHLFFVSKLSFIAFFTKIVMKFPFRLG